MSNDMIYRQDAIDVLDAGAELLRRVLDDTDIVNIKRKKYEWGLGLIEACISDIKELPSAQPEQRSFSCGQDNDSISRKAAIAVADYTDYRGLTVEDVKKVTDEVIKGLKQLPSEEPEYKPVTVEDFAKTMSENSLYNFVAWRKEALMLMKEQGFVICKKTI